MVRPRLLAAFTIAWFALILLSYHLAGPAPFWPWVPLQHLLTLLCVAGIAAAALGWGALLLRPLGLVRESASERLWLEMGAGLGILAMATLAVAALRLLYRPSAVLLVGAGWLLLAARSSGAPRESMPSASRRRAPGWLALPAAGIALSAILTLAASLAPPEFYDALVYHLVVPDQYVRSHGIVALPGNYYSHFPANMGMLYALGLLLRGEQAAQPLHWLCGALAAGALHAMARRHVDRATAWLAAAFLALTPGVMLASTWAIADLGVTLFATLCSACVLNLWREPDRRGWLAAAGLFAGLALGCKYTAAPVVCAPAALAIALRPGRESWRGRLADAALFGALSLAIVSPWLLRNTVIAGNPFAPYLSGGAGAAGSPDLAEELARRLPSDAGPGGLLAHALAAPWNASMRRLGAAGYLGPLFLMLSPLALMMRGLPKAALPAGIMAAAGLALWALTSQVGRYLFPVVPLLALLAAIAARRLPRWIAASAISWCLLYGVFLFSFLAQTIGVYGVVTGAEPRDSFLSRRAPYYPAARFLETLERDARVLMVGEGRTFYIPRDHVAATPFDAPAIDRYARGSEPELLAALRADRITHLLVSGPELRRTRGVGADDFMRSWFPSGAPRLLFEAQGVRVYGLPP